MANNVSQVVKYCDYLRDRNSEALGFIPLSALKREYKRGRIFTKYENDELCGYLYWTHSKGRIHIIQACIEYDVRRRHHGFSLVQRVIRKAAELDVVSISCWCADDLEANDFWQKAGFDWCGQREGGQRRGRMHNLWVFTMPQYLFSNGGQ